MKSLFVNTCEPRGLRAVIRQLSVAAMACVGFAHFSVSAQLVGSIGVGDILVKGTTPTSTADQALVGKVDAQLRNALANTRKFNVIDYPRLNERVQSQGLTLQGFYDKAYKSTELSQAGLDYILTLDVISSGAEPIGAIDIRFELLGVAHATQDFASKVTAQAAIKSADGQIVQDQTAQNLAMQRVLEKLVNQVMAVLHPIRVMMIDENSNISLNYGAGVVETGDTILIYPEGEDGEPLPLKANGEPDVAPIATLQVTDVERKFAQAQALEGFVDLELGQEGRVVLSAN